MSINKKKVGWTAVQLIVGCIAGLIFGWLSLALMGLFTEWVYSLTSGGFLPAVILLIAFLIVLGAMIGATAESVRRIGRFIPRVNSTRKIYEGSFLGLCAAVALLSVTRGEWLNSLDDWGGIIKLLAIMFYLLIVLPLKLITGWIPAVVLLAISAPIGAIIGYYLPPTIETEHKKNWFSRRNKKSDYVEEVK